MQKKLKVASKLEVTLSFFEVLSYRTLNYMWTLQCITKIIRYSCLTQFILGWFYKFIKTSFISSRFLLLSVKPTLSSLPD